MHATVVRTGRSTNIKDRQDTSSAIYDAAGGVVAQSEVATPVHLGTTHAVVRYLLGEFDFERVLDYRQLVWRNFGIAILAATLIATGLLFCSVDLRRLSPVSWIILIVAGAITAALQYFMMVWGTAGTRRLFRGK
jgi:hypothetical protein